LFLNPDGTLIFKSHAVPRNRDYFMKLATEASQRFTGKTGLADYDKTYQSNDKVDRQFLKDYITLRVQSYLFNNAALIERYVDFLTISELNSYDEVLFIHRAGPVAFGRAYNLAVTNRKIVDSIYNNAPPQDRIAINPRIINNTQEEAVKTKDKNMAYALYGFIRNTWKTDYKEGDRSATQKLLDFYKSINDTLSYYNQAGYHYDQYYMLISLDSIQRAKATSRRLNDSLKNVVHKIDPKVKKNPSFTVMSMISSSEGNIFNVANMLNNAAWDFYTMGTRTPKLLTQALLWSRRSIEIDPNANHFDTLAHIFYRLGYYDEAQLNQNKAITFAAEQKFGKEQIEAFKKELSNMKNRTL
jgi:tetratricopeptide (TPR) repeat protein